MKTETIVMCVVLFLLGMLLANILKSVCGCRDVVEGNTPPPCLDCSKLIDTKMNPTCGDLLSNTNVIAAGGCDLDISVLTEKLSDKGKYLKDPGYCENNCAQKRGACCKGAVGSGQFLI